ncbi:MAG: class I SAM-dependent methyltransferase [Candidatus Latescibacteria bacterium]|nr:class I SAM-dependent methyltransferase [Candidatus Latescibacterota bacterium]
MASQQSGLSLQAHRASRTANLAACVRAYHCRWHESPIFADTYAYDMISDFWRAIARYRLLSWITVHTLFRAFRPIHTEIILRSRYAEDRLMDAVRTGVPQYVILGAGLDTFSMRQDARSHRLRVYELDHPATQEMKRERALEVYGRIPASLVFVPIDFETDRLDEALRKAGFDPLTPSFFSWLGTTYYLSKDAIRETLGRVAGIAAPGSRIVLDYKLDRDLVPVESLPFADKLDHFVARRGEPMLSTFTQEELKDVMSGFGFAELENLPAGEQKRRYLNERSGLVDPAPNFSFALYGVS